MLSVELGGVDDVFHPVLCQYSIVSKQLIIRKKRMFLQILPLRPENRRACVQDDNCLVVWMGGVASGK